MFDSMGFWGSHFYYKVKFGDRIKKKVAIQLKLILFDTFLHLGATFSYVIRKFAHGATGRRIDPP